MLLRSKKKPFKYFPVTAAAYYVPANFAVADALASITGNPWQRLFVANVQSATANRRAVA